jgi:hypothetical protein
MRLPAPPERYDQRDQASMRSLIEQSLLQPVARRVEAGTLAVTEGSLSTAGGVTASAASGVATDMFVAAEAGIYLVFAYIPAGGETYLTEGIVVSDGTTAAVRQQATGVTFNIVLSVSGNTVRGAQFSGAPAPFTFRYLRIG